VKLTAREKAIAINVIETLEMTKDEKALLLIRAFVTDADRDDPEKLQELNKEARRVATHIAEELDKMIDQVDAQRAQLLETLGDPNPDLN